MAHASGGGMTTMKRISVADFQKVTRLAVLDSGTTSGFVDAGGDRFFEQGKGGLRELTYEQALQRYDEAVKQLAAAPHRRAAQTVRADQTERPSKKGDSDALVNEQLMFCLGKSPERVRDDMERRLARFDVVIGTKADNAQFETLQADPALKGKRISFDEVSQVLMVESRDRPKQGLIVVVAGGATDLPIAQEAARIAEAMGSQVERISDSDLLAQQHLLKSAKVIITICGQNIALPNAVAALTDRPVVAAPTKDAFGEGLNGAEKLMAHMAGASEGVSFVNIDNGFGAAYVADKINRRATSEVTTSVFHSRLPKKEHGGFVVVTTAGSADIPVAERAALATEALGVRVVRLYDHGVNDPEGLKVIEKAYQQADVVIVAAGLEGGLPNHVAAITQSPVVAVPTSVGYGTGAGGVASMLCALNACSPGITVVPIDDAGRAATVAHKISAQSRETAGSVASIGATLDPMHGRPRRKAGFTGRDTGDGSKLGSG
jgi:NCAIR mutase (PurE)-related protein